MRAVGICLLTAPLWADPLWAEAVVTTRIIRAGEVIERHDLTVVEASIPGTVTGVEGIAGQEARVALYPGRPIRAAQIGPPAVVERNQPVPLAYHAGGLAITTEGRALARGGTGDVIPVLNLSSRNTVKGRIMSDGTIRVGPEEGLTR